MSVKSIFRAISPLVVSASIVTMASSPSQAVENSSRKHDSETAKIRSEDLMNKTLAKNGHNSSNLAMDPGEPRVVAYSYDSPGGFGEGVNCIFDVGPIDCVTARNDATTAASEAGARYPSSLSDGVGDAFRHCYWNALMTVHIGADQAKSVADNHEESASGSPASSQMDYHNNQVGRDIGASSPDEGAALNGCVAATTDGRLQTSP